MRSWGRSRAGRQGGQRAHGNWIVILGTPIGLLVRNKDQRPHDYSETDFYPRPSHADWTYLVKYDIKASSGGGRSSARETIGEFTIFFYSYPVVQRSRQAGRAAGGMLHGRRGRAGEESRS